MTVYVDNMRAPFGRMIMCHMFADTTAELDAMADAIGVARKWRQHSGTWKEHYDICLSKRARAVVLGAEEVDWMDFGRHVAKVSALPPTPAPPVSLSELGARAGERAADHGLTARPKP